MKTLIYFSNKIRLLEKLKIKFRKTNTPKSKANALLTQMYSDENKSLFI